LHWSPAVKAPTCPRCQTTAHLQLLDYEGVHRESRTQLSWGAMEIATRPHDVEPVAEYECTNCGYHDKHPVPRNWDPDSLRRAGKP
jgi:Zn ribbon nucleic-acid-binding protein